MPDVTNKYSCPIAKDCKGGGHSWNCSFAVKATKKNKRVVLKKKPACFDTFRRPKQEGVTHGR